MSDMTPREIVHELDQHIIGQAKAKKAVAIALRNRWRRMQLKPATNDNLRQFTVRNDGLPWISFDQLDGTIGHLRFSLIYYTKP